MLTEGGRMAVRVNVLAVLVLMKKWDVSEMATEFAVSALWRVCKSDDISSSGGREGRRSSSSKAEVGCMGVTKDQASELFRLLKGSRGGVECIETMDFKGLKRPF
ncbi:hypothetical protein QOZ80_5BG0445320 [Eleusine coracana subsp. coracana]|nr:hypothetical protein QOZ80_5BG0445320 [Eleusine coracana subsp. coracana]